MEAHPTPQELREFAEGGLPKEQTRNVVAHFLRGCGACRAEAAALLNLIRIRRGPRVESPERLEIYDQAFDRAFEILQAAHRAPVSSETPETSETPAPAWLNALAGVSSALDGPDLVEALLARAWALRHEKPAKMLQLSRLAVLTAGGLSAEACGEPQVADLRCAAWACLGNASRIVGDVGQAQEALDHAATFFEAGTGDSLLKARLFDFQASLESARGRHDRALVALDVVVDIQRDRGDQHLEGRALISKGLQAGYAGRPRQALRLTREGLDLLDEKRDPDLVVNAFHNLLWFQVESGRPREAQRFLEGHRDRLLAAGETQRLDLLWLEGRIAAALNRTSFAQSLLETAYQGFEAAGLAHKAANVTIDLAALALRQGEPLRARAFIRSAEDSFRDLDAPKSTLVALSFLHRRLSEKQVPVHLVLRLGDLVRRTQTQRAEPVGE